MSHYYDEDPSVISNEQRIQYQLNHHKIDLIGSPPNVVGI